MRACAVDETFPLHSHALVNALACWRVCLLLFATAVICYQRGLRIEADVVSLSEGAWRGGKLEARLLSLPAGPQPSPSRLLVFAIANWCSEYSIAAIAVVLPLH